MSGVADWFRGRSRVLFVHAHPEMRSALGETPISGRFVLGAEPVSGSGLAGGMR